jgi:hypothetical protein
MNSEVRDNIARVIAAALLAVLRRERDTAITKLQMALTALLDDENEDD